jgi:hypothetical protein
VDPRGEAPQSPHRKRGWQRGLHLLLWVLTGCAGGPTMLHQAQAVPMRPEPIPSFPQPRHTPAGAGASPLGMPWQGPESRVERSPNKPSERRSRFEAAVAEVHNFVLYACRDTRDGNRSTEKIRSAVTSVWDIAERTKKR